MPTQMTRAPETLNLVIAANNQAVEVQLGQKAAKVSFIFVGTTAGEYALVGTEGDPLGATAIPVTIANLPFEQALDEGNAPNTSVFVQVTAGAPVTVRLITETH